MNKKKTTRQHRLVSQSCSSKKVELSTPSEVNPKSLIYAINVSNYKSFILDYYARLASY